MYTSPTEEEIQSVVAVLQRLPRGFLPFDIFATLAERIVLPCFELSIFRYNKDKLEILLTQRPADDHYWPNGWHLPGGVLLATDQEGNYSSILERILHGELQNEHTLLYEPQAAITRFQETKRGRELVLEYFSEVAFTDTRPKEGHFFPVNELPEHLLDQYHFIIPQVVNHFQRQDKSLLL